MQMSALVDPNIYRNLSRQPPRVKYPEIIRVSPCENKAEKTSGKFQREQVGMSMKYDKQKTIQISHEVKRYLGAKDLC